MALNKTQAEYGMSHGWGGLGWAGGAGRSRADSQSNVRWDQLELPWKLGRAGDGSQVG